MEDITPDGPVSLQGQYYERISEYVQSPLTVTALAIESVDGSTEMYGSTNREDFIGLEGPEDNGVDMIFCWDRNKKLTGIVMNVACPAQVTEAKYYVSSDYWGEVRKQMEEKFPRNVYILPQLSAAGDISPRDLPRGYKSDEPDMLDVPGAVEIGKRLVNVIDDAYPSARNNIQTDVIFKHAVKNINLSARMYSEEEYEKALEIVKEIRSKEPDDPDSPETAWNRFLKEIKDNEKIKKHGPWNNKLSDFGIVKKQEALIEQYGNQDKNLFYPVELHAIRLGDMAFATNPFDLFVDYGFRITGKSKAKQTDQLTEIGLFNSVGQLLSSFILNNENANIDLSAYKKGIYIIQLSNSADTKTQKIIKN